MKHLIALLGGRSLHDFLRLERTAEV